MSAELAARIIVARAVAIDYARDAHGTGTSNPDWYAWAARLHTSLTGILAELPASAPAVATQLERIANAGREALDDELTDRQTALEQLVLEVEQLSEELEIR